MNTRPPKTKNSRNLPYSYRGLTKSDSSKVVKSIVDLIYSGHAVISSFEDGDWLIRIPMNSDNIRVAIRESIKKASIAFNDEKIAEVDKTSIMSACSKRFKQLQDSKTKTLGSIESLKVIVDKRLTSK